MQFLFSLFLFYVSSYYALMSEKSERRDKMFNEGATLIILFSFTDRKKNIARYREKRSREKTVSSLK